LRRQFFASRAGPSKKLKKGQAEDFSRRSTRRWISSVLWSKPKNAQFKRRTSKEKTMPYHHRYTGLVLPVALSLLTVIAVVNRSRASVGTITKADLSGAWQMTLLGNTGCGLNSLLVTFTLNGTGSATNATITSHVTQGSPCTDGSVSTGNTFTVNTLNANGTGTAGLTCGPSCGWTFNIQVAPDRSVFNAVDVSTSNPNNLLQGVAVHQ